MPDLVDSLVDLSDMHTDTVYLNDIFSSFCGEGFDVGRYALFIRCAGCNLDCNWCDEDASSVNYTPYSDMCYSNFKEVLNDNLEGNLLVLTGGEPLIQNNDELSDLISSVKALHNIDDVLIETNSTRVPTGDLRDRDDVRYVVSPKPPSAFDKGTNSPLMDEMMANVDAWSSCFSEDIDYWKLIFKDIHDLTFHYELLSKIAENNVNNEIKVVFQPLDSPDCYWDELHDEYDVIADWAEEHNLFNVRLIPQTHKILGIK